eukprot:CAMPEP_0185757426 /NCGR_PEP_ID=MMETSP1174-20130828/15897_1 /TAXON_ID=35687 /ORGANISM="Dictyocha speculum, Strain CCMP1381" /LENGTH=63 /DNA_ID=CAMNT_0028436835 /DNA_START=96 /DNA_END=284 /DNA_ORIENTATION=+
MQQFQHIPELRTFIMEFFKIMGDHFTELGDAQEATKKNNNEGAGDKPRSVNGGGGGGSGGGDG